MHRFVHSGIHFRVSGKASLDELFTQVLGLLSADELITLDRVMHDGTKIRAKASGDTFRREDRIREGLPSEDRLGTARRTFSVRRSGALCATPTALSVPCVPPDAQCRGAA